jgi:glycine cleavage system aminomethyltransferase T
MERSPLYEEHLLLGGTFDGGEGRRLLGPSSYPSGEPDVVDGSALVDLSGTPTILLSGDGAQQFAEATLAGRRLGVGEAEFEASLLGDGSMASVPLASRTGQQEYVVWDLTPRGETLFAWLGFVQGIESGGFRPYGGVSVEEVGERLVPLLLWGSTATAVLSDYARGGEDVPAPGGVGNLMLDGRIESLVASPRLGDEPAYLLLVPPAFARVMWRSLLSFPSVSPLGTTGLAARVDQALPWMPSLGVTDTLRLEAAELLSHGLVREEGGFIGARGIFG